MNLEHICFGCFQEKPDASPICPSCGFDAQEEQPFLALPMGTVLGRRYMVGKVLGMGGFGITYLGFDLTLDIKVAIKEYMPSGLATRHADRYTVAMTGQNQDDYQSGMERFLEEARTLAKLQNAPNIVSVQNYFRENNTAYFVMEYIDGMSLKAYVASQGGKIPYDQALTILMPVMHALTQVHALGLLHRDISPDNVSITANGESKLLDFGAARFSAGGGKTGAVILKHGYAPEEQYSTNGNQGPWTDVYAMGATLYRCVTGELPPDSIVRLRGDTLKSPSELGVPLPPNIERAIMTALAVKAENRFPSMEAFMDCINGQSPAQRTTGRKGLYSFLWLLAMALGIFMVIMGVVKVLSGDDRTEDSPTRPPDRTEETRAPDRTEQETRGVDTAPLRSYHSNYLNLTVNIPERYTESESDLGVFSSPDGRVTLQVGFYDKAAGFPVYDLSDVEENAQRYVQYSLGLLENRQITKQEITYSGYRRSGLRNDYLIQYSAVDSSGAATDHLAAFIECQNDFGCYHITGSYPQGDAAAEAELFAVIDSFQSGGPADSIFQYFHDEKLPFHFFYWEDKKKIKLSVTDDLLLMGYDTNDVSVSVDAQPMSEKLTKEVMLELFAEEFSADEDFVSREERWDTESGGIHWFVDEYVMNGYYLAAYAGEIDGYVIAVCILADTQDGLLDWFLLDVINTIRPVK